MIIINSHVALCQTFCVAVIIVVELHFIEPRMGLALATIGYVELSLNCRRVECIYKYTTSGPGPMPVISSQFIKYSYPLLICFVVSCETPGQRTLKHKKRKLGRPGRPTDVPKHT